MPLSEAPPGSSLHIAHVVFDELARSSERARRVEPTGKDEALAELAAFVDSCSSGRTSQLPRDLFGRLFALEPTSSGEAREAELLGTLELCRTLRKVIVRALWRREGLRRDSIERINECIDRAMIASAAEIARKHNEAVAGLEEEMDLREKFVAALSHDLRNPVAAAKMTADFILGVDDIDRANQRRLIGRISKGMERVESMIRNLLDALRIKNRQPPPLALQECDLSELLRETVQGLEAVYGSRFELREGKHVQGLWDIEAVRRVIENLCVNAVKYGSRDHPVRIAAQEKEGWIEVRVHNHGTPIPAGRISSLFNLYVRPGKGPTPGSMEQTGWGVGLYLVRSFVEAHGGVVRVTSSLHDGTTFSVQIPKWATPQVPQAEAEQVRH